MATANLSTYQALDRKIEELERLAREISDLGQGLPFVEKNARSILSFTRVLRYGVSDLVEVLQPEGA